MELTKHKIILSNAVRKDIKPIEVQAVVNAEILHLCITESIAKQLELSELEKREFTLKDGSKKLVSYVGPVKIELRNRICFTGALVTGNEIITGTIPMDDMEL